MFNLLKLVKTTNKFVYLTINRCSETNTVDDRSASGRPRETTPEAAVKPVVE